MFNHPRLSSLIKVFIYSWSLIYSTRTSYGDELDRSPEA